MLVTALSSVHVNHFAARHSQEPPLRICRTPRNRPIRQRRGERLGKRIFRGSHIPRTRRQKRDQLSIAPPRHSFRCRARLLVTRIHIGRSHAPAVQPQALCLSPTGGSPAHWKCVAGLSANHWSPVTNRYIDHTGRTSTVPWLAPGHRAAQEIAASRSATSIR